MIFEISRKVERCLTTELNDDPPGAFLFVNIKNVFKRERLEIELIAGVVVRRNRFRIRVHHDGFKPELFECKCGVHTAVIKLNPLPDSVGTTTENHDFLFVTLPGFVLNSVGGIVIRRVGLKLSGTSIDQSVGRNDAGFFPRRAHFVMRRACDMSELHIGIPKTFRPQKIEIPEISSQLAFGFEKIFDVAQEPGIDRGEVKNFLKSQSRFKSKTHEEDPLCIRSRKTLTNVANVRVAVFTIRTEAKAACLEGTKCFLERLLERSTNRHGLTDTLHLSGQGRIRISELFESEPGQFDDTIVDRWLKAGGCLTSDIVRNLIEGITHREFRGDLCDGESGRLRGQCR